MVNCMHPRKRRGLRAPGNQRGVGLLEVLIAVLIMGIGMLGIAAMQATALRNSQSSLERSQAVIQTYAILDAMRVNAPVARIGGYDLSTMTCEYPSTGSLVANDLHHWIDDLHRSLGDNACGQIKCGSEQCSITVQWDDSRGTEGDEEQQVVTETRL